MGSKQQLLRSSSFFGSVVIRPVTWSILLFDSRASLKTSNCDLNLGVCVCVLLVASVGMIADVCMLCVQVCLVVSFVRERGEHVLLCVHASLFASCILCACVYVSICACVRECARVHTSALPYRPERKCATECLGELRKSFVLLGDYLGITRDDFTRSVLIGLLQT